MTPDDHRVGRRPTGSVRSRRFRHTRIHLVTVVLVLLGLAVTAVLTTVARASGAHNEQRLTTLQTRLSGQVIQTALFGVTSDLDRVVGLAAASPDPAATFRSAVAPLVATKGPFASAVLVSMTVPPRVVASLGKPTLRDPSGPVAVALYQRSAHSSGLITTRVVSGGTQRLGFLVSASGSSGTYVVAVGEPLPADRRVTIPSSSPESELTFAAYYGLHPSAGSLIESNAGHLPITGPTATVTVPFGDNHLTLVASPRVPLAGTLSEDLPWLVLAVGVLLTVILAVTTEWLARRRRDAEDTASATEDLYEEQRSVARLLQVALLPKTLPRIAHTELAARYIPASNTAEIGGDWYSVIKVDDDSYVFVVGDVSGHDVEAATVMAPLRFTVRSLAKLGLSPCEVLTRANEEISAEEDRRIATVLVARVVMSEGLVTLASAGHPPPFLVAAGSCEPIAVTPGPPLGLSGSSFAEETFPLPGAATVVAFTDGLVERRDQPIDVGLGRLRGLLAGVDGARATDTLERVLGVLGGATEDDIALLVIRQQMDHPDGGRAD